MVDKIFLQILNMSFTASFVIIFVLIARLLLKKSPKVLSYALWGVVLFRLVFPFSFESVFSLLPVKTNPISQDIVYAPIPTIDTGISAINHAVNSSLPAAMPHASVNPLQIWVFIGTLVWLLGIAILLVYSILSLMKLQKRLKNAVHERDNIYLAEHLETSFVMGIIRPKIYLPASLTKKEKGYILLHEEMHIKRFDHIVKIFSFFVLCLHWFNPLVWAAFFISGKDMEMSCDEAVIKQLGSNVKKEYSTSLLTLATGRRIIGGTPLAFGEGDTKGRIKNVLNYKKPAFWVVALSLIIVVVLGIGLATNQKSGRGFKMSENLTPEQINEVNTKFEQLLPANEGDTASVESLEGDFILNPICHFFSSYYEKVTELDMGQFVYYIPRETYLTTNDKEEIDALKQSGAWLPFEEIENSPVPFGRIPYATVNKHLKTYANISLEDMTNMGDAIYLDEYESFYSYASDFGPGFFNCTGGMIEGDIVTLYSDNATLTLKQDGDNYYIMSHIKNEQ